uniref:Uncharacterized protein MANES_06G143000 n=1 Tax=Rhizophora mucronata TaxID=61149 RepID=A0A2P2KIL4_RHIMU
MLEGNIEHIPKLFSNGVTTYRLWKTPLQNHEFIDRIA